MHPVLGRCTYYIVLGGLLWSSRPAEGQPRPTLEVCALTVEAPGQNVEVDAEGDVTGTAAIPPRHFLWVFTQRTGLANWTPFINSSSSVDVGPSGRWSTRARFGSDRDVGVEIVLWALVVDASGNDLLAKSVARSSGNAVSLAMNPTCEIRRTVRRKRR